MTNVTISFRYGGDKVAVSTEDTIILDDLLQQLSSQGRLPAGQAWVVTKADGDEALRVNRSLADNGIVDGDVLDLALPTKAGAQLH